MSWPNFIESGKISLRFLLPITLLCASFLFLPESWKQSLQIGNISTTYAPYIGPAFLISSILILIDILIFFCRYVRKIIIRSKIKGYIRTHIRSLTHNEKSLLREFYMCGQDTLLLPFNNPIVVGLISKRILIQAGNNGTMAYGEACFSYYVNDKAKDFITPESIELPENPTQEDLVALFKLRPDWADKLDIIRHN